MYRQRLGARAEYQMQEGQRVKDSASLADTFRGLRSLTVDLQHYTPECQTKTKQLKYEVNLDNAKAVFRFQCLNDECVGGDFDLSDVLAAAVAQKQTTVTGEELCRGWRSKVTIDTVHCGYVLRYKLTLGY